MAEVRFGSGESYASWEKDGRVEKGQRAPAVSLHSLQRLRTRLQSHSECEKTHRVKNHAEEEKRM